MSSLALLDACILVPQRLSSLLLTLAEHGLYEPRWSDPILTEAERALIQSSAFALTWLAVVFKPCAPHSLRRVLSASTI